MNIKDAITKATLMEGGKKNISVAEATEIIGCFLEVLAEEANVHGSSFLNRCRLVGERRAQKRAKSSRKKRMH